MRAQVIETWGLLQGISPPKEKGSFEIKISGEMRGSNGGIVCPTACELNLYRKIEVSNEKWGEK